MSGNGDGVVIRLPGHWFNGDDTPCEVKGCGGNPADHEWVGLNEDAVAVDCSGQVR